jgi:hypothetical protein
VKIILEESTAPGGEWRWRVVNSWGTTRTGKGYTPRQAFRRAWRAGLLLGNEHPLAVEFPDEGPVEDTRAEGEGVADG